MEDFIELTGLKFPQDSEKLVKILNKIEFRGKSNWIYNPGGLEVFDITEKNTHYSNVFMRDLAANYLECKEYLERISEKITLNHPIHLRVNEDYFFVLETNNSLFSEYSNKTHNPRNLVKEISAITTKLLHT